jgi:hypothetical protein
MRFAIVWPQTIFTTKQTKRPITSSQHKPKSMYIVSARVTSAFIVVAKSTMQSNQQKDLKRCTYKSKACTCNHSCTYVTWCKLRNAHAITTCLILIFQTSQTTGLWICFRACTRACCSFYQLVDDNEFSLTTSSQEFHLFDANFANADKFELRKICELVCSRVVSLLSLTTWRHLIPKVCNWLL